MVQLFGRLGPGLIFAASSIGTSHLVQSTRAGADYGFSLLWLIIAACLLKLPAFWFGAAYGAATGKPVLDNYRSQGHWAVILFLLSLPLDMFFATAAVSMLSAGVLNSALGLNVDDRILAVALMTACAALLIAGRYHLFESIAKTLVLTFSMLALVAAALSIPRLGGVEAPLLPDVAFGDRDTILFLIAITGWMPTSVAASVFLSAWVVARSADRHQPVSMREAALDFNVGYFGTMLLALGFVIMGTAIIYAGGAAASPDAAGFAAQLTSMFTDVTGLWAYPVIAVTSFAVLISTVLSLMDACPRAAAIIAEDYLGRRAPGLVRHGYTGFVILQTAGATLLILMLLRSFQTFLDLATSVAFLSAPVIAFLNHRAMTSREVPAAALPGPLMRAWSLGGIGFLTAFAILYALI